MDARRAGRGRRRLGDGNPDGTAATRGAPGVHAECQEVSGGATFRGLHGCTEYRCALGLLVGFVVPPVGVAAAIGVILFFVGAIVTHVRAQWYAFAFPSLYLLLGTGALALNVASF